MRYWLVMDGFHAERASARADRTGGLREGFSSRYTQIGG
jgi:hypothetical protein